jgi:hypothetical protein
MHYICVGRPRNTWRDAHDESRRWSSDRSPQTMGDAVRDRVIVNQEGVDHSIPEYACGERWLGAVR